MKITKSKPPRDEDSSSSTDDERDESSSDEDEKSPPVEVNAKNERYPSRKAATKDAETPVKNNNKDEAAPVSKSDKIEPLKLKEDSEIKEKRNWRKVRTDKKKNDDATKSTAAATAAVADSSSSKESNTSSASKSNKSGVSVKSDSKLVRSPTKSKDSSANNKTMVENSNKVNSAGGNNNKTKVVSPVKGNNVASDKTVNNNVPSGASRLRSVRKRPALENSSRSSPKVSYLFYLISYWYSRSLCIIVISIFVLKAGCCRIRSISGGMFFYSNQPILKGTWLINGEKLKVGLV